MRVAWRAVDFDFFANTAVDNLVASDRVSAETFTRARTATTRF